MRVTLEEHANYMFYSIYTTLKCWMVLCEQMFMQGSCVERNKTSGLTALILYLYLALGN